MQEMQVWSLGQKDPLEKKMATYSSVLPLKMPWTEQPGGLQSMGSQRVRHNWAYMHSRGIYMRSEKSEQKLWNLFFKIIIVLSKVQSCHISQAGRSQKRLLLFSPSIALHSSCKYGLYNLPGCSVHGLFQIRRLDCIAVFSFRASSQPRNWTHVSRISCTCRQTPKLVGADDIYRATHWISRTGGPD